jgi:hypothetical protein
LTRLEEYEGLLERLRRVVEEVVEVVGGVIG